MRCKANWMDTDHTINFVEYSWSNQDVTGCPMESSNGIIYGRRVMNKTPWDLIDHIVMLLAWLYCLLRAWRALTLCYSTWVNVRLTLYRWYNSRRENKVRIEEEITQTYIVKNSGSPNAYFTTNRLLHFTVRKDWNEWAFTFGPKHIPRWMNSNDLPLHK